MTRLSIRWRLTLWYAAALAVILFGFCMILLLLMRQQLLARTDAALLEEVHELGLEVRLAKSAEEFQTHVTDRFFEHTTFDFLLSDSQRNPLFVSSRLTNVDPKALIQESLIPDAVNGPGYLETREIVGDPIRMAVKAVDGPNGRVVIQAMTPLKPFYLEMQTLQLLMIMLLPVCIATALMGGYVLAARALAPVEQIVKVASSITIADLDRRIEVLNPHDEIGRLASTLNSLIARSEQAVTEIQRFTADASHELRTPLAVLRAEAESALRSDRTPAEYQATLSVVVEEATRLGSIANQLLMLSRNDAGMIECRHETVRLDAMLIDVTDQLRLLADQRELTLDVSDLVACEVQGDDIQLSRTLFNILDNAIKYSRHGGTIVVQCRVIARNAVMTVTDQGVGIAPQHLPHVFDRFYRVDPSRNSESGGEGLGLAIVKNAVNAHGGTIEIQSELGVGTTMTIRIPGAAVVRDELLPVARPVTEPMLNSTVV